MMTVAALNEGRSFIATTFGKGVGYTSDYDETVAEIEALLEEDSDPQSMEDIETNVTNFANACASRLPSALNDPDATDYSSSFSGTASGGESISDTSDAEVESEYRGDNTWATMFGNSVFRTRKKKVTTEWRNFIRPLMWRCKWTELKIKELVAQAARYSRGLVESDLKNLSEQDQYTSKFNPNSLPSAGHHLKVKSMKRRKRKQVEKVTNVASYTSDHCIFSYFDNKKTDPEVPSSLDNGDTDPCSRNNNFGFMDDWLRDGENSLEQIFWTIDIIHTKVHRLRNQLDTVMSENGVKPSSENLSFLGPYEVQTSAAHSPALSIGNADALSIGAISSHLMSEFDFGDLDLPDCLSNFGEAIHIPDIIESTVGLLSAADVTVPHQHIMESGENILDDALLESQICQNGLAGVDIFNQPIDNHHHHHQNMEKEDDHIGYANFPHVPELVSFPGLAMTGTRSCLATESNNTKAAESNVPKNKRKRGERKAGPCGWNALPGEPDKH